jgi:hypothetical protein
MSPEPLELSRLPASYIPSVLLYTIGCGNLIGMNKEIHDRISYTYYLDHDIHL